MGRALICGAFAGAAEVGFSLWEAAVAGSRVAPAGTLLFVAAADATGGGAFVTVACLAPLRDAAAGLALGAATGFVLDRDFAGALAFNGAATFTASDLDDLELDGLLAILPAAFWGTLVARNAAGAAF